MQEKICNAIADEIQTVSEEQGPIFVDPEMAIAVAKAIKRGVAEIAKLFERKVIWEETLKLNESGSIWVRAQSGYGNEGQYWLDDFLTPGQRVRVIVEDIDESRT